MGCAKAPARGSPPCWDLVQTAITKNTSISIWPPAAAILASANGMCLSLGRISDSWMNPEGPVPEACTLRLTTPPGFEAQDHFFAAVRPERRERKAHCRKHDAGRATSLPATSMA